MLTSGERADKKLKKQKLGRRGAIPILPSKGAKKDSNSKESVFKENSARKTDKKTSALALRGEEPATHVKDFLEGTSKEPFYDEEERFQKVPWGKKEKPCQRSWKIEKISWGGE